ncbi:DUF4397 domain-containing protein [Marinicella sp. S1101]|uniref:DUF4397 domain-containing protein n=1 Tax=Marinicella marina TaxID=2996016 RepID=UPI002260AF28|nr:DUF4397 domain-containing protein [Marinicella marina]MCX7553745.1 DUF4397 domain-containing protein [Marinicella marina]MDJ1140820.1 DUF4397 domain-containing protein [Marinicella marina]
MNKIKFLTQLGLLTTATVSMATQVNVNHLAPFANTLEGTAVSINVNGDEALSGVQFLQSSGYIELAETGVAPGMTMLDVFAPPGGDTAAISATVDLAADTFYSVSAIGDGVNQPLSLLPLVDDNTAPADGNFKIRIIHAAPFAADINDTAASIRLDDETVVGGLDNVLFGQNSGYLELPAGNYDLNVSTADGSTRLIDIAPLDLAAGTIVNVFATGDGVNQPVGAYAVFGDGTAATLALEAAEPPAPTRVNVAHLAPFAEALDDTAVSIDVNGNQVLTDVKYKQASGYLTLADDGSAPGSTLLEVFAPPGGDTAAITAEVDLAAETDYTVVAIGDGANQPLSLLPLVDDNSTPADGAFKLRIVHAAPFADTLADTAVSIRTDGGDVVAGLTGVEFGAATDYLELPAGTYDLNVSTPDGSARLIDLAPVTLGAGDVVTVFAIGDGANQELGFFALFGDGSSAALATEPPFTSLTAGLNGSWYNPATNGQGFSIEVFPELGSMSIAWYTFDTTFADGNETAVVGEPNHRWLTAQGPFDGTRGELIVYLTEGGIFNQDNAVNLTEVGTLNIDFNDCRTAMVDFTLDDSGLTGMIPIQRISGSTVEFCESTLAVPAQ